MFRFQFILSDVEHGRQASNGLLFICIRFVSLISISKYYVYLELSISQASWLTHFNIEIKKFD